MLRIIYIYIYIRDIYIYIIKLTVIILAIMIRTFVATALRLPLEGGAEGTLRNMYVRLCVCTYMYIYIYMHTCIHTYINIMNI